MENKNIHEDIILNLNKIIESKKIPNILFHGATGTGKKKIVFDFIKKIYNFNKEYIKDYVLYVNCAHSKGIKFIREEIKFFAKIQINSSNGIFFKSIILSNADKLTIDAQSALRRCIELFSHNTRFFIIIEDKSKLLKPIVSRFSDIFLINISKNLNTINFYNNSNNSNNNLNYLKNQIKNLDVNNCNIKFAQKLYNKGYTSLDLNNYITNYLKNNYFKYKLLLTIQKVKKEFRNEELIILFILNLLKFRCDNDLENILSF
tara:strand:- start:156 stop:938 length:783 start_codon:yes stop_codon:yes gene_type:complete